MHIETAAYINMNIRFFSFALIFLISCGICPSGENEKVEARFTEIIIKVKPDIIIMPEGTYKPPLNEVEVCSPELQELNKEFNLIIIEKMYALKKPAEEVGKEFPEREARAPEGIEEPDLENTFLLKFPEHTDPKAIIEEYEKLKDVIYVEENKVFEIF